MAQVLRPFLRIRGKDMRFAAVLALTLLGVSCALGQSAPASSSQSTPSQAASAEAPPAHPITKAQVDEIRLLTKSHQLSVQVLRMSFARLRKNLPPYWPEDVIDDLEARLEAINYEPIEIQAYQRNLSTEDAAEIIAFYKSPAGQHLADATPEITREIAANAGKMGRQVMQEVLAKHAGEIEAAAKKYQQEHATQPTITSPN